MSWDKGFDFRGSSGYVTDPTDHTYVLSSDSYPTTRNSVTFGWTTPVDGGADRDVTTPRLAGINYRASASGSLNFQVDLPATGDYDTRLAIGDPYSTNNLGKAEIKDGATSKFSTTDRVGDALKFIDASDAVLTGVDGDAAAASWVASNTAVRATFAGTTYNALFATALSTYNVPVHLFVSQVGGGGGGFFGSPLMAIRAGWGNL